MCEGSSETVVRKNGLFRKETVILVILARLNSEASCHIKNRISLGTRTPRLRRGNRYHEACVKEEELDYEFRDTPIEFRPPASRQPGLLQDGPREQASEAPGPRRNTVSTQSTILEEGEAAFFHAILTPGSPLTPLNLTNNLM